MTPEERKALREFHWNNKGICDYCSDPFVKWEEDYPCGVIKVLDYLDLVDPHTEQSVQVEPENTEHNNCDHVIAWTMYLHYDGKYGLLTKAGEQSHQCTYCPKCGEKL